MIRHVHLIRVFLHLLTFMNETLLLRDEEGLLDFKINNDVFEFGGQGWQAIIRFHYVGSHCRIRELTNQDNYRILFSLSPSPFFYYQLGC